MGPPSGTGALQRSRKSVAGCLTALSSSRTCGFASAYVAISVSISSLDLPLRPVKKAFTSGWLNRYDDVAALTPDMTSARSAAVQFGGSAAAVATVPTSIEPAIMPAPITLRKNMVAPLTEWFDRHGNAQRGPIPPPPPGRPGRPMITSMSHPSSQYQGSAQ